MSHKQGGPDLVSILKKSVKLRRMVEQVSSTTADPTLGNAILPGTSEAGLFGLDTEALHETGHLFIEVCGPIENQIFCGVIVWKCLPQLLDDPCTAWAACDFRVHDAPSVMCYDAVAVLTQEQHLRVPRIRGQWPAM